MISLLMLKHENAEFCKTTILFVRMFEGEAMTKNEIINLIIDFVNHSELNRISSDIAIYPELAGLKLFDEPLIGFSSAVDSLYTETFKEEGIVSPDYLAPKEWLQNADSVIAFFLPFTKEVRESNRTEIDIPYEANIPQRASAQWLHGRIEGQVFVDALTTYIEEKLKSEGFDCVCPTTSERFKMLKPFVSNWSERHAAYASGLGTFGLSKGLITQKGMAGRIGSVITSAHFEQSEKPYSDPFEYCIMCGACQRRCPANAIDKTRGCALGKDQLICGPYVKGSYLPPQGSKNIVRYGCGKCQTAVPCEFEIPKKQ